MSPGPAPGGIIIATGSPGTTRIRTKTTRLTPSSVSRRWTAWRNRAPRQCLPSDSGPANRLRQHEAGAVRRKAQALAVDHRLAVLEQRDHQRVVGDVPVHRLV